ncbi:helix-turn-helix transcriptional regulator [Haloarcula sp. S1CR25-12]|uniref:Helix-turn-helix transcriptional regulator n=1 Tax=Haloarcula saliterrae TaxID=2950534 RepID=A0ABU2F7Y9_9EURY|nr:helix-turn-helix transcriptional regulator [Haloarcula sp. S1CR25-12]MDS0258383.1 helix-turn-helix transcriptional regulator [Haloarcula sp. S1CR25-12]
MKNELDVYRSRDGLSQGELAETVGVSRQTINAIERERYDPSLELAFKLAAQFDCSVADLFDPDIDASE